MRYLAMIFQRRREIFGIMFSTSVEVAVVAA